MMSKPEKALVPRLRFPEFRDAGAWEEMTIGDVGSFYYGKSAPKWSLEENAPTPCVRYGELYTRFGATITETYSRTNIDPKKLRFSKGGEVLVPRVGEKPEDFGKCCSYLPLANIAIGEMISVFETAQNPLFYTYYFRSLYAKIAKVVEGQNVKNLYYAELEPLKICLPTSPEQQKIADCLSSLDDLITTQGQKVAALKRHKKGLMQQLFPAPGQTTPHLRFPEFRDAGAWEEKKLGDCLSRHPEYGINAPAVPYSENLPTYLRITDISEDGRFLESGKVSVAKTVNGENYLLDGDIVLARTGASVGKSYKYDKTDGDLVFAGFLIRVRPDEKELNSEFLFQFLTTEQYWRWVDFSSARSGQPGINGNEYASLPVPIPPKEVEQQKIADCLSSLDDLITAQGQKVAALERHKKGLMQQLFPASDEVGG